MMQHSDVFKKPFSMDSGCYIWCNDGYQMCYTILIDWESKEELDKLKRIVNLMNGIKTDPEGNAVEPFKFVGYSLKNDLIGAGDTEDEAKKAVLLTRGWGYLTGKGALGLPGEEARKIQLDFMKWTISTLKGKPIEFKEDI
jgi:hypothetical protein